MCTGCWSGRCALHLVVGVAVWDRCYRLSASWHKCRNVLRDRWVVGAIASGVLIVVVPVGAARGIPRGLRGGAARRPAVRWIATFHCSVGPLALLLAVCGDVVCGDECVAVFFAVGGDFGEHPSPLTVGRWHGRERRAVLGPHEADRIELRNALRRQGASMRATRWRCWRPSRKPHSVT